MDADHRANFHLARLREVHGILGLPDKFLHEFRRAGMPYHGLATMGRAAAILFKHPSGTRLAASADVGDGYLAIRHLDDGFDPPGPSPPWPWRPTAGRPSQGI